MLEEKQKRVLVISNNCFSKTNSNGRTLGNLFYGWPKDKLAQFCISTDSVDCETCTNYYIVTDSEVLQSVAKMRLTKRLQINSLCLEGRNKSNDVTGIKKRKKTAFAAIVRHFLWNTHVWKTKEFKLWLDSFNPQVIVWQCGDSAFLMDIAYNIARERKIPLLIYNTEDYYFKEKNFMQAHFLDFIMWPYFRSMYRNHFRRTLLYASHIVHLNKSIKILHDAEFDCPSDVIYNCSGLSFKEHILCKESPVFSYLGNLGVNRHIPLIEIGKILNEFNPEWTLHIYGAATREVECAFEDSPGIIYHGKIAYDEVVNTIYETDILFHVEAQTGTYKNDLKYAFSTKIADSLSSGSCFLVYASMDLAVSKYIAETKSGWVVSDKKSLLDTIRNIINDDNTRKEVLLNAKRTAEKNHQLIKNASKFRTIICAMHEKFL